jgi:hypothetical protein
MRAFLCAVLFLASSAGAENPRSKFIKGFLSHYKPAESATALPPSLVKTLSDAALAQTKQPTTYDPDYRKISYPGGDVAKDRGVCSDVVVRAYRKAGVDLQVEVHEDMKNSFSSYPRIYGRDTPDSNIDHRRVPNLMVFFSRKGMVLPISKKPEDYSAGDIVAWDLHDGVTHVGLVVEGGKIVHNIGYGPKLEDVLFDWPIIGHFRYAKN